MDLPTPPEPAQGLVKLSGSVWLLAPSKKPLPGAKPCLVVICGWLHGSIRHLSKYAKGYSRIMPEATILVVQCPILDAMSPWNSSWHRKRLRPAVEMIEKTLAVDESSEKPQPRGDLLMHAFSNGGMVTAWLLMLFLTEIDTPKCNGLILDSCPGQGRYRKTVNGFIVASGARNMSLIPSLLLRATAYVGVWIGRTVIPLATGTKNAVVLARTGLNDARLVDKSIPRLYIYSMTDELVSGQEVILHAEETRKKGYSDVEESVFDETAHCAHVVGNPDKYWASVLELSKRAMGTA